MIATLRGKQRAGGILIGALLALALLWPAIANGLPLFFPDSGGYLYVAWGNEWLIDRSSFYGAFIKPFTALGDLSGLWLALIPQLLATILLLNATAKKIEAPAWALPVAATLLVSTGPWYASQLMPDAYAVPVILIGWLCASRAPNASGSPLLWLAAAGLCLTHSTFPAILVASVTATLLVEFLYGTEGRKVWSRVAALAIAVAFTVVIQLLASGTFLHRPTYSPNGNVFLFASLNEDGVIQPWLDRHCPQDQRVEQLCQIAPQIPRDSQQFLWSPNSIAWKTIWKQRWNRPGIDWDRQFGIAARGALMQSPGKFLLGAVDATTEQFFSYRVLDDECPYVCLNPRSALQGAVHELKPELSATINAAPQVQGRLRTYPLLAVTGSVSTLGLLGVFVLLPLALRRRDSTAASLLAAILASLLANAFVTGTLSDVHDRYQSRVIWIAPVACALILLRWRAQRRLEADTP